MGMMTVLMQLRKVCNHPDLFEPRSVVTPFVVPSLSVPMASCVFDALKDGPVIERLSVNLIQPLWCGSSGLPSIEVSLRHDIIESRQLQAFDASGQMNTSFPSESKEEEDCPKELRPLFEEIQELHCRAHLEKSQFHQKLNAWRCQSPAFPYSTRFLETVEVRDAALYRQDPVEVDRRKVVLTPASLLEMRMTEQQRADDMDEVFDKFVFCVPRAGARRPKFDTKATNIPSDQLGEMLLEPLEELMKPSRKVDARLSSFFPDKKLIQFDSGKLQTLAELLHKLKRGGHRALIFTQMGKMLDILEAFLNINGHTYLRLDGSTGIERRQRYMDRFNNDTKIFCFILSTRSGGTGVNLTGADTVIFYDSDWNPAMDAQAQDRAHRIGQTRDVHIYRLITEHTIEENILMKAKQKRNLDIMVMDQGKFDASQPSSKRESQSQENDAQDVYTKGGLRAILGVSDNDDDGTSQILEGGEAEAKDPSDLNKEQMEIAMTALEDDDDVKALRGAQKEAAEELQEFDENAEIKKDSDAEDDDAEMDENEDSKTQTQEKGVAKEDTGADQKKEESELEKEFEAWQTSVGLDASTIEASLSPMERYGLNFREEIDPFYSIFSVQEYRRKMEATEIEDDIDVDEIDREKAMEERRAMDEGDLLATRPRPEDLIRQRNLYKRERARLRADKMRRKLTGENWSSKIDGQTKNPFWYNSDTGEAIWDKPVALIDLEAEEKAHQQGWNALPLKPLVHVMEFLIPYPERTCCSAVCRQWRMAAHNVKFVRHVYPVEMGALAREESRREYNHYSTIAEALSIALPGDTIGKFVLLLMCLVRVLGLTYVMSFDTTELADGHYWVNEPGLHIDMPIRIVGDESNAANVVLEMSGSLRWAAKGGWIEGVTFRRPKISSGTPPSVEMLSLEGDGRVDIISSVFDNEGSTGAVTTVAGTGIKGRWYNVSLRGGGRDGVAVDVDGSLELVKVSPRVHEIFFAECSEAHSCSISQCSVRANGGDGLKCTKGKISLIECRVEKNHGNGVTLSGASSGEILRCHFSGNDGGIVHKESGCVTTCSGNTASVTLQPPKNIPGFRVTMIGSGGGVIPARPTTVASSG
jgi:superfamily II DNA/RNA helicase